MIRCIRCFLRHYGKSTPVQRTKMFSRFSLSCAGRPQSTRPVHSAGGVTSKHPGKLPDNHNGHAAKNLNSFSWKTHACGELDSSHAGQEVTLCGWLQYSRMGKFITLRDWHGVVQVVFSEQESSIGKLVDSLPFESVIEVSGIVQCRPEGQQNKKMKTGDIEMVAKELKVLNTCLKDLPFQIQDFHKVNESLRMRHRFLDLRSIQLQHNLRTRASVIMKMREFLSNIHGFVDVETPTLFRKTPGGAREFVVPTHMPGQFYSLPQSPQQFKQLLMVGGIDRYYQIARCYRDESAKPDRQPEFTQVDIEMSFIKQHHIKGLIETMLAHCWPDHLPPIDTPFPKMTYKEAMDRYGVDKPDTRFAMEIEDVTSLINYDTCFVNPLLVASSEETPDAGVHVINFKQASAHLTNRDLATMKSVVEEMNKVRHGDLPVWCALVKVRDDGSWKGSLGADIGRETRTSLSDCLKAKPGDLIMLAAGNILHNCAVLGKLRLEIANLLESKGEKIRKETMNFLWVEDFPLFLPREDGCPGWESAHHPFTAPHAEDWDLVYQEPEKARSQHYDLVLNGTEIGGGSIRIHDSKLQRYILQDILMEDPSPLEHLLRALDYGCPPHGGIALGLDRLVAIMCNASSIRDVIAFPKSSEGKDLMAGAPAPVTAQDRDYYHLHTVKTADS